MGVEMTSKLATCGEKLVLDIIYLKSGTASPF